MQTVIIVIHLMVVVALVAVVLLQRSEGGALGIGGGGGFMTARGQANVLTRTTAILAAAFFITSIGLTLLTRFGDRPASILDRIQSQSTSSPATPASSSAGGILNQLPGSKLDTQGAAPAAAPAATGSSAPAAEPAAPAAAAPAAPAAPSVPTTQ
ncbi:preprotein translocase subunit SecG [Kaistia algarum]|uniref:preprotein translocase subunit SecG n=1 Tax=Kaistia algarum TaxID=2083279 RepID=UPI000CE7479E|nr:preprotein translocase subunit SecG [Kaistia algarum]MCX5514594.1 preprotein translocase subunit SecG [Kaistia algarum]PPE78962.1 preprotein translocase subunit SecG [Kaistia algarum]